MSIVRYEELDQITGELLPERALLGVVRFMPFGSGSYGGGDYGSGGYGGGDHGGGLQIDTQQTCNFPMTGEAYSSSGPLGGILEGGLQLLNQFDNKGVCQMDTKF